MNGDYHIQNGVTNSSAYNAGTDLGAPNHDFDSQNRPQGGAYDIGADELLVPQGAVTFNPILVNFGIVAINTTASRTVTVTNTGTAPLAITSALVTGTRFAKSAVAGSDTCTGTSVAVGATCQVVVTFNPNNNAFRLGLLTLTDNGVASPQSVVLSGI